MARTTPEILYLVLITAFVLVTAGMVLAVIGVITPGLFIPGVVSISLGMLAAAAAGIMFALRSDD